jgi:two-component system LytT family sensor kinase
MPGSKSDGIGFKVMTPRRWLKWGLIFGVWTFLSFLFTSQIYLGMRMEGMSHFFWRLFFWQWSGWCYWAVFTPFVLWLGKRYPLKRSSLMSSIPVHLCVSASLTVLHALWFAFLTFQLKPFDPEIDPRPFWGMLRGRLLGQGHLDYLFYGAILCTGYALEYYQKYREREFRASQLEAQLAQAQLQALRMQLHPHFLFNTLNGIAGLVRDQKNKAAVSMIVGLSDLLRHTLENAGKQEVPLSEELEFLELYLDIQQMRFPDRLKIQMEIAPDALEARVPNLILQPLVENAIRHGVALSTSAGTIGVSATRDDGLLKLKVCDDGPGLPEAWSMRESKGIGLSNTRARLQQLYGQQYRFDVQNRELGGVEAMLTIPLRLRETGTQGDG